MSRMILTIASDALDSALFVCLEEIVMPTYDYECTACAHRFEAFHSMSAEPLKECPECKGKVQRLIGTGAGILFKGSGFYQTDYRSSGYTKDAAADKPASETPKADASKKDKKSSSNKSAKKAQ
jgi:putative FmdB family regulatory protein